MNQIQFFICKILPAVAEIEGFTHPQHVRHEALLQFFGLLKEFSTFIQALQSFGRDIREVLGIIKPGHDSVQYFQLITHQAYSSLGLVIVKLVFFKIGVSPQGSQQAKLDPNNSNQQTHSSDR